MAAAIPPSTYPVMGTNTKPPNRIIYGPYFGSKPAYQLVADAQAKGAHIGDIIAADAAEQARAAGKPNPVVELPGNNKYWISPITGTPEMMPSNLVPPVADAGTRPSVGPTSGEELIVPPEVESPQVTAGPANVAVAPPVVTPPSAIIPAVSGGGFAPAIAVPSIVRPASPPNSGPIAAPPVRPEQASRPTAGLAARSIEPATLPATRIGASKAATVAIDAIDLGATPASLAQIPAAIARRLAASYSNLSRDERLTIRAAMRQGGTREI